MRDSSAAALAVVSTPPVSTTGDDNSGRRGVRRAQVDEDLRVSNSKQAPATVNAPVPIHKRSPLSSHGAASKRYANVESERRQSSSSESNDCRTTIYLDARDESASEVSIEDSTERDVAST